LQKLHLVAVQLPIRISFLCVVAFKDWIEAILFRCYFCYF
jgi:hypothetical protein